MDYVYIVFGTGVMFLSCLIQYRISATSRRSLFYLPFLYALLTFWLGFIALLFSFVLIFIGELATTPHQEENNDVFYNQE